MLIKMSIKEARKILNDNDTVFVAVKDLGNKEDTENLFIIKTRKDYGEILSDIKTATLVHSMTNDFVKQLKLFTEKQDIENIVQNGILKTVLVKRLE